MTFLTALYTLIISPLELLFEVIFMVANRIIGNEGLSIIFLSLAVNFLVLPLYKRADELQAEERDIQARMAYRIKRTKQTFKGDERFMMLQEYYRINKYKPIYALKSSASLLLQIPFFIAAYRLLSGMQSLQGMSFGFITDLGKEDATFMIGSFPVNILPIVMTLINIVTGIIYTKGQPLKSKIQVYGLAVVFLVLLYHSPAGLVFYWLLNNVFALVKNIFYKLKNPKKVLSIVLAAAGAVILVLVLIRPDLSIRQKVLLGIGCVLLAMPLVLSKIKLGSKIKTSPKDVFVFVSGAVLLACITGLLIPSTVINASAEEFFDVILRTNPNEYILSALLLSVGSFVLWGGVFYFFMSDKVKAVFSEAVWIMCGAGIMNYMFFGTTLGTMSSTLQYDIIPDFKITDYLLNIGANILVIAVFHIVYSRLRTFTKPVIIVSILAIVCIGGFNSAMIGSVYYYNMENTEAAKNATETPEIPLSKNGQNVIVLMLDRSLGTQVPYIFNEKPELLEQFDGFTYYPNTISYGSSTIFGSPALYGGYDYTPDKINARVDESLASKQNEALQVMPRIFGDNGYTVTICDPSYAGYQSLPDLSIYKDHPEYHCFNTIGSFSYFEGNDGDAIVQTSIRLLEVRNRNFFFFSIMKISPLLLQETIYDGGLYNESASVVDDSTDNSKFVASLVQSVGSISESTGYNMAFLDSYSVLINLPNITRITDSSENTFLMMANKTAHSPCLLQEPDYVPSFHVDNTAYDVDMVERYTIDGQTMAMEDAYQVLHYHINMAAFLKLGDWFDYLREQGVYDNTRIIIVADHGRNIGQFGLMCGDQDLESFLPLFMVKDFNSTGFTVCEDFMTNGDTPAIAMEGLIEDPVNPFTGNPINMDAKNGPQAVFFSDKWNPDDNTGNVFDPSNWYSVEGDPHDPDNWKYLGFY